jgi:hypothetical protein
MYDACGTVTFLVDGSVLSRQQRSGAGPMATATRPLAIGDRLGSNYSGFPGYIDEVRITRGEQEFRPVKLIPSVTRHVFVRMSEDAATSAELVNQTGEILAGATIDAVMPGGKTNSLSVPALPVGGRHALVLPVDTSLKPGEYSTRITVNLPNWGGEERKYQAEASLPVVITQRPLPHRMPVVMWGVGGTDGVVKEIPRLKEIGFTHCLGLRVDYQKVWDEGADAQPGTPDSIRQGREMLNAALEQDLKIVSSLHPGSWLRNAEVGKPFRRIDREGNHYGRQDVSGVFARLQKFCFHTGAAMGRAYGDHPAYDAALLHSEVRGASQVSFHPEEIAAYRSAAAAEIPDQVRRKDGVRYTTIDGFPKNRVIEDDDPILSYLRWFWTEGDGWNGLNTRLHEGLREHIRRDDFWTFYDPACRVPSLAGSGGAVDVLSHWTYSYPDPIRIGLCTDELFEMARVSGRDQEVMKMTQIIWYRSQTAPENARPESGDSPWVDQDPDAAYITIAPMHLREAFWWKMSRPIQGIMYHGWQSLVETDVRSAYRYTNPSTQHELKRLIDDVVVPLGPALMQVPDPQSDVVFLESFASQMFAGRGTYGWNHSWAGDMYHLLMYAQLQPRVMYEESLLAGGLAGAKVLVMADCDVLTESAVAAIKQFQVAGGLVIGDAEVCPAIERNFTVTRFTRDKKADVARERILKEAERLRAWLDTRYQRAVDSTHASVVTHRRRSGTTDYIFAVNDRREYGQYVGPYGRVMEDGVPASTTLRLTRQSGHIYDLIARRELAARVDGKSMQLPLELGPCDGRLLMITERPIRAVTVIAPSTASRSERVEVEIAITDGVEPIDGVIPVQIRTIDPEGMEGEFTGYYGAADGRLKLPFDFAANDRPGLWRFQVTELATGRESSAYVRYQ